MKERNYTIDIMRLIAAFFVVCIHTASHAFGDNSTFCAMLDALSRFAVPFFFVITGYYFDKIKVGKYILNIIKIMLVAVLVYYLISCILNPSTFWFSTDIHYVARYWVMWILSIITDARYVLLNFFPFPEAFHLWFLLALIYGVLLLKVIVKFTNMPQQIFIMVVLFLANIYLTYFVSPYYTRNVWFLGLPYLLMGYILSQIDIQKITLTNTVLVLIMILSYCLIGMDALHAEGLSRDHYALTPIFVLAVFLLCFRYKSNNKSLAQLGKKGALFIYVYHIAILHILDNYVDYTWYTILRPIIVYFVALGLFIVYVRINNLRHS